MKKKKSNAITVEELKEKLNGGPVRFSFQKKDGTVRKAYGTRKMGLIPKENQPTGMESSPKVLPFYDLDKGAWRSLQVETPIYE